MLTDVEIARAARMLPVDQLAARLGLTGDEWEPYGRHKAKVSLSVLERLRDRPDAKLVLVTAINPTPAGEGKTTTTVGLADALNRLGTKTVAALREPSLGPCFGVKGGAAGGGYAQVVPMEDINLHFTGDIHAVTAAHNLLAAIIDNHLHQGNQLSIDPRRITWRRVVDLNDRALRNVVIGLGGRANGFTRETGFDITVASELMAILCLADSTDDLRRRIDRMVIGFTADEKPVTAGMLKATGALTVLLREAVKPNLVQTLENTPAFIHGGPFANIAHGCNSLVATKTALKLADVVVTEAGFGADLGAEKFFSIKCRYGKLQPAAVVVVATVRALKMHGGLAKDQLGGQNSDALLRGCSNLFQHCENLSGFGLPVVVAINRFPADSSEELDLLRRECSVRNLPIALSEVWSRGGAGGEELARQVLRVLAGQTGEFCHLYEDGDSLKAKIETVARRIYRADSVIYTPAAEKGLAMAEKAGLAGAPVCMAKTQYSFSDDPKKIGCPRGFSLTVRDVRLAVGAGFVVAICGDIMTMPGLPKVPAAEQIDIDQSGLVTGLF